MSSKVANILVVELGILIAILAWLAFSRLPSVKQQSVTEEPERIAGSLATVTPALKPRHRPVAVDYRADAGEQPQEEEQPPTVPQYDQEIATMQQYDQGIATVPSADSDLYDDAIIESSPTYAEVYPEPVVYPSDYLVPPPVQFVAYTQPAEIIVFSNPRPPKCRQRPPACVPVGPPPACVPAVPPSACFPAVRPTVNVTGPRSTVGNPPPPGGASHPGVGGHGAGVVPSRNVPPRPSLPNRGTQAPLKSLARN